VPYTLHHIYHNLRKKDYQILIVFGMNICDTTGHQMTVHFPTLSSVCSCTTCNKKSELMLVKHARAYSSSCLQVILVYLHPFCRISILCSQKSQKITKNTYFWSSRPSMLTFLRSSSQVLVMISSMSVPICNHFHARQANKGIIMF